MPKFEAIYTLPYQKDSVVAFFKNEPYDFSPGTKWNYNNSGYFLLGYIIEKVSGQTYTDYILNNLVKKARLTNTSVDRLDSILTNRAMGYSRVPNGWRNAEYISMEFPYSAGAIVSTVEDLYRWNKALYSGKIISPALLTKMTTPYMNKYGYGLGVDTFETHKRIGHGGGIPGFVSYDVYYPMDNIHIVVLSNNESPSKGIARAIASILFDKEVVLPYKHKAVAIHSKDLERYVGKYQTSNGPREVVLKEGKLYLKAEGADDIELTPESNHKFFFADRSDAQLNFELNQNNSIRKVQLILEGFSETIKKMD
jgi:CubicO group peptidase (beta-lactamase class C family)